MDNKRSQAVFKYAGLAFQIVATILISVYLGGKLDAQFENETPWFTLLGSIIGVVGTMVYLIVKVSKSK